MGILANTVSVTQLKITGEFSPETAGESLEKKAFRPIETGTDELSVGWVTLDDKDKSDFSAPGDFHRDHYLCFALRRDERKIPSAILRRHLDKACAEFLAEHPGLNRVPKQKKEELREAVRGALIQKTLPTPSTLDVVWDTRTGVLTLATLSKKVIEQFVALFTHTFPDLGLTLYHPLLRAEAVVDEALRPALTEANQTTSDAALDQIEANTWIGSDFLQWLLYQTVNGSSDYRVRRAGPSERGEAFVAYINDKLVLVGGSESGVQKIAVTGPQDRFSEVRTALEGGKVISDATIYLEKDEWIWKLTLRGQEFQFASFKTPAVKLDKTAVDEGLEAQGLFFEKMHQLETGFQLFDSLFSCFLIQRLSPSWGETVEQIRGWETADAA